MIERLQRIATFLHRFRLFIIALGVASFGIFAISLFQNPWIDGEVWLIPSLLSLSWSLALYTAIALFQHIPERVDKSEGWRKRTSIAIRRGALWLAGASFLLLSGALIVLSYQLLRTYAMG
ncbi:MAG: hypothetical protein GKR91_16250 [Pseudomonadales bacterium]|nr:hypothetical protein [Pseudomonadales bacterium]